MMLKHFDVIPDAAQRRSEIHNPGGAMNGKTGVMDSGFASYARTPE
jgi:hypothetical protein